MHTKRRGPRCVAVALALASAGVVGAPDLSAGAPALPQGGLPNLQCGGITGTCLDISVHVPGESMGGDGDSSPPSTAGGGGGSSRRPTPQEIARQQQRDLLIEAETLLPQPVVETNPGAGRPSFIDMPTFFAVANWLPPQEDIYRNGPWEIVVTAVPSLRLDPGEPGAPTIQCEDGGTRFDANGPSPREQASRPGACAYAYTRRTGVAGRPDHWAARMMVSWSVDWQANFPLPEDLVTSEVMIGTVEREVEEIQTVVES